MPRWRGVHYLDPATIAPAATTALMAAYLGGMHLEPAPEAPLESPLRPF